MVKRRPRISPSALQPTWVSDCGRAMLYLADCRDVLPTLAPGSVDCVVTDPPYGVEFAEWDSKSQIGQFAIWLDMMLVVSPVVTFTCGWPRVADWCAIKSPTCFLYWYKSSCMGFGPFGFSHIDPMPVYGKVKMAGTHDVVLAPIVVDKDYHPTQKPLLWAVRTLSKFPKARVVLDSFMGSGTTGVACIKTGRRFIGIELEPKYFAIAKKRIIEAIELYDSQLLKADGQINTRKSKPQKLFERTKRG